MLNLKPPIQEAAVTVLAALPNEEDRAALGVLFRGSNWLLSFTGSIAETMQWLKRWSTPVVLCDHDLPDGSWKDLLAATKTFSRPPRLVVTSRLAEERLWAEALNLGCHDVLQQPFHARELFRVLNLAWRNWHDGAENFVDCAEALPAVAAT